MLDHWANYYHIAYNNKTNSIFERTEEFFSSIPSSFQSPVFSQTAPWKNKHNIKVDVSITKQINKQIDSQDFMRSLSLELITRYNVYTHIYTDGSKFERKVSASFHIPALRRDKKI